MVNNCFGCGFTYVTDEDFYNHLDKCKEDKFGMEHNPQKVFKDKPLPSISGTIRETFKKDSKDNPFSKPLLEEITPQYYWHMGIVLAEGGNKYGFENWKNCPPEEQHHYWGALARHMTEARMATTVDERLDHLSRVGVNANFLYYHNMEKLI